MNIIFGSFLGFSFKKIYVYLPNEIKVDALFPPKEK